MGYEQNKAKSNIIYEKIIITSWLYNPMKISMEIMLISHGNLMEIMVGQMLIQLLGHD